MEYTHELKKLAKSEIELTFTIPRQELKTFLEKAANKISQQTKIEGFRPGKASYEVIKQRVGEMKIYEEAAALAAEKAYIETATKEKIEPLGSPKIEFVKLAPDNDFVFKATVAMIPEVKVGDWKSLKIQEKEIKITDQEINKVIEDLRQSRATEVIEEKEAAKNDKVEIDMDISRDNVPIEGGAQKKYPLIIGSNHFIPGFEDNLIGMKANQEKEFELTFPEKYHNSNLAGKKANFKVKLLAVYKRTLPELNDEFTKTLGQESVAKLKEQIKHNLEHEQHHKEEERLEIELIDQIIEKSEVGDIPDRLIDAEANKMVQEMQSNIAAQGIQFDEYLKHLNKTQEQLKIDFVPQAIKRVKSALILRAIFFNEKIEIKESEIDQQLEGFKKAYQQNPEMLKNLQTPEYRDYLRNMLGNQKVLDLIKTTCVERKNENKNIKHDH